MTTKLGRTEFITGLVTEELVENLPTVRVSKALAKEILNGDADSVEIRVTKDFATATVVSVENAIKRALLNKQAVTLGEIGTIKPVEKAERTYPNTLVEGGKPVVKPAHTSAKLSLSKGFKEVLANA